MTAKTWGSGHIRYHSTKTGVNEASDLLSPKLKLMALPACLCGEGLQGGEALSLLAGTTALAGSGGRRLVDRSVAAHPGDHLGAGQPDRGERGKGTVAA